MPKRSKASKIPLSDGLVLPEFTRYFFMAAVISIVGLFFWTISSFFPPLTVAILIAVIFNPMYQWLLKRLKGYKNLTAFLSTLIVLLLVLVPLTLFVIFLAQEALDAFQVIERKLSANDYAILNIEKVNEIPFVGEGLQRLAENLNLEALINSVKIDLYQGVQEFGNKISDFIVYQTGPIVRSLGNTVITLFVLVFSIFFLFRDGDQVAQFFRRLSPLPAEHEDEIENKLKGVIQAIVVGSFGTAILQGIVAGIGLWVVGVENLIFWITIMSFAALMPYFGIAIIWLPFGLSLIAQGDPMGWFLLIWGTVVDSSVDNFVRPFLIGGSTKMHPLATFLAVLGGLITFGVTGLIYGPIILSLTITIIHIYELEYRDLLKP